MRRLLTFALAALALSVTVPIAVDAATGTASGLLERQTAKFNNGPPTIVVGGGATKLRGLDATLCTVGEVSVTVSVQVSGGDGEFTVQAKGGNQVLEPGPLRFFLDDPTESTTLTAEFARNFNEGQRLFSIEVVTNSGFTYTRAIANYVFDRGTC